MKKLFLSFLWLTCILSPLSVTADDMLADRFSDEDLIRIMKNDGYGAVSQLKDGVIKIKIDGRSFFLMNKRDGDLQAYYAISGVLVSYEDMNEWNRTKRLSRAYLDDESDPVLEADLLANGGLTETHVTEFFEVFTGSVRSYRSFLLERDKS